MIDAPTPIRPDTKLFWAGSPTATNWKRQPRPACYENGRHRRFDFPHDPSAPDLQEEYVCFFLNETLSKGKTIWRHRGQRNQRRAEAEKEIASFAGNFESQVTELLIKLKRALNRIIKDDNNLEKHVRSLNEDVHELPRRGGILSFPLMTVFTKSLYE